MRSKLLSILFVVVVNASVVSTAHAIETTPTGSVLINGQAAYTALLNVPLRITRKNATEMRFRNTGYAWSDWEDCTSTKNWALTPGGAGQRKVDAQFRNAAGAESDLFFDTITAAADLQIAAFSTPLGASVDTTIKAKYTVKNFSDFPAATSTTSLYLSSDSTLSNLDVTLSSQVTNRLAPWGSDTTETDILIPGGLSPGTYYLIVKANSAKNVVESNATIASNTKTRAIQIGPDLVVSALGAPPQSAPGATIMVTETVRNTSPTMATSATTTGIYFSTNAVLDASDTLIGERAVAPLAPGEVNTGTAEYTLPVTGVGKYYIFTKTDNANAVFESYENNNTKYTTIQLGPDLVVLYLAAPVSVASGSVITIKDTTKNWGTGMGADPSATGFYLSSDTTLDAGDTWFGERAVSSLGPAENSTVSAYYTLPAVAPGVWYIIGKADNANVVAELNENNNSRSRMIIIL